MNAFVEHRFDESERGDQSYPHTGGSEGAVEMAVRSLELADSKGGVCTVKLQIYHPPGDDRYHAVTVGYLHQVQGVIVLYDPGSAKCGQSVKKWMDEVKRQTKDVAVFVVATKADSTSVHSLLPDVEAAVRGSHYSWMEVSARSGLNVEILFHKMALLMVSKATASSMFHLDAMFNHDKRAPPQARALPGAEDEDGSGSDDESGVGARITSYFKGKFKRQRRRIKQRLLQTVNATDSTVDPLYQAERQRYLEFDARLKQLRERLNLVFDSLETAFDTGVKVGDDFQWYRRLR